MPIRIAVLLTILAVVWSPAAMAMGNKDDKAAVSFHVETDATDNPKMIFAQEMNGVTRHFRRVPEISIKDMAVFTPFPNEGGDYGVVFRLKPRGANRLSAFTAANQGRHLLATINGRVVDVVMIDSQIQDGVLVMWKGLNLPDIQSLDAALPRAGEEGKKKR
jgi:preprotein translocase subunit SecD